MKRRRAFIGALFCLLFGASEATPLPEPVKIGAGARTVVNKIIARVNGVNLLLSDLKQPRLDTLAGVPYMLDQLVDGQLLVQEAAERKLLPTSLDLEKQIVIWKETRSLGHLNDKDLEKQLRVEGLTFEQFRRQLSSLFAIKRTWQAVVQDRVVITSREVESYHEKNPAWWDTRYKLQTKLIPAAKVRDEAEAIAVSKKTKWIDSDWIESSKLADSVAFVSRMKVGQTAKPLRVPQGYQIIKLVEKEERRQKALSERWGEIEDILRKEKLEALETGFVEELRAKASIVYLD